MFQSFRSECNVFMVLLCLKLQKQFHLSVEKQLIVKTEKLVKFLAILFLCQFYIFSRKQSMHFFCFDFSKKPQSLPCQNQKNKGSEDEGLSANCHYFVFYKIVHIDLEFSERFSSDKHIYLFIYLISQNNQRSRNIFYFCPILLNP